MNYINDLFAKYEIRKSKKQKTKFIEWIKDVAVKNKWDVEVSKGSFGARNIVIGNPKEAKVIFTAHYDTCARMIVPNFITPKNIFVYLLYQILLCVVLMVPCGVLCAILWKVFSLEFTRALDISYLLLLGILFLMLFGPANKHTANDNTSGVATILGLIDKFDGKKDKVAMILFDFEEIGLVGSSSFSSKNKDISKNTLLVNFDCVSDGTTMLFVLNKNTRDLLDTFKKSYESNEDVTADVVVNGVFYPSDQACFKKGVGVCAMKHNKLFKSGYIDKIHTIKDTAFRKENIEFLVDGSYELYKNITK